MARKRVIYQSEALFNGPTGAGTLTQLSRVQTANYGFDITRQDVNQYGQLAALDRVILEQPVVSLDFSYYANSGQNEQTLGLTVSPSQGALSSILSGVNDKKNYYILVSPEGSDANLDALTATGQGKTIGIGNASITSYQIEAAVGAIPTVTVNAEGYNMKFYPQTTGFTPDITPENGAPNTSTTFAIPTPSSGDGFTALRPGDVTLSISGIGVDASDLKIQSFTINADIGRDPIQKLGSKFAFTREITFPVVVKASVDAVLGDIGGSDNLGKALSDIVCDESAKYNLTLVLNQPKTSCGGASTPALTYTLKGVKLDSQSFSSSIGDNKTVTMDFSAQIGGASDQNNGLFIKSAS
jgi:hypothetical protein